MASAPESLSLPKAIDGVYCPQCYSLCLGAKLLPCGHLTCRNCLRKMLHRTIPCDVCITHLPDDKLKLRTAHQLGKLLSSDFVIQDLVKKKLLGPDHQLCPCEKGNVTRMCSECGMMSCTDCSELHTQRYHSAGASQKSTLDSPSRAQREKWLKNQINHLERSVEGLRGIEEAAQTLAVLAAQLELQAKRKLGVVRIHKERLAAASVKRGNFVRSLNSHDLKATVRVVTLNKSICQVKNTSSILYQVDNLLSGLRRMTSSVDLRESITHNELRAIPRRVVFNTADNSMESNRPLIKDILILRDGRLLLADNANRKIKVVSRTDMSDTSFVQIDKRPRRFAQLADGLVALTTFEKGVFVLDVNPHVIIQSEARALRDYRGITGGEGSTLIVSCGKDEDGPATVDVIQRDGVFLRTIIDGNTFEDLTLPKRLSTVKDCLVIPDYAKEFVYKIRISDGNREATFMHLDFHKPTQAVADPNGNIYIVGVRDHYILLRSANGEWRGFSYNEDTANLRIVCAETLCLTEAGFILLCVAESRFPGFHDSVVVEYALL